MNHRHAIALTVAPPIALLAALTPHAALALDPKDTPPPATAAPTASAAEALYALKVGDPGGQFVFNSFRNTFLAVHLLPAGASPENLQEMTEIEEKAPTLARVHHAFFMAAPSDTFDQVQTTLTRGKRFPMIFRDTDNTLPDNLHVRAEVGTNPDGYAAPVLLLFDPSVAEVWRRAGKDPHDHAAFAELLTKVRELTRDPATREANLAKGLALQGYDPVSYFQDKAPSPGKDKLTSEYKGITYRFATSGNRALFNATPEKFLPAYGGWCATAMAESEKVDIDPKNYKVTAGRLFLFYKGILGNALKDWNKDEKSLTTKADTAWNTIARAAKPSVDGKR